MSVSRRRVRGIVRKELREYRRNRSIVVTMAIIPLIFVINPMISVFALPASSANALRHGHALLYLLGIPALVPAVIAAYAVVGERAQSTLEPLLTTPIRREELLLGKALAALVPSLAISYAVFGFFLACVELFAHPAVASALVAGPDLLAQVVFTPLLGRLVHLGRYHDLGQVERHPRRAAARHAREPPDGRSDFAGRIQRHSRKPRPRCRRCGGIACPRQTRLADHVIDVRPRTAHHRYQVMP